MIGCEFPLWAFSLCVIVLLMIDLLMHRKSSKISMKESLWLTGFWIMLALLFNLWIWHCRGSADALTFLTAYAVEKSLSVDNLFVFLLIFKYFHIKPQHLHKILFWGIFGALVFRAIFIAGGLALVNQFEWVLYIFGAFLIYAGLKLAREKEQEINPDANPVIKFVKKNFKMSPNSDSGKFIDKGGITPLFLALIFIEISDIIFAVDSIPAVFAITRDPFLVYTSNVFAILGLRSLFFTVQGLLDKFHYLHYGLSFILVFIGVKMLIEPWFHVPITFALTVILASFILSILASVMWPQPPKELSPKE